MLRHGLLPYWYKLYSLNKVLGHRNDIFRNVEDSFILKYGDFKNNDVCLDIGSGESAVPVFIRQEFGSKIRAIDVNIDCLATQKKYCSLVNCSMDLEEQDATELTYSDGSFDKVIAISAIEHFPGDGDIRSVREFSRVLKRNGKCLLTVPFGCYEEVDNPWYYSGFERRYNLDNLYARLLSGTDLEIETLLFLSPPECGFVDEVYEKLGNIFELYYKGNYHITNDDLSIGLTLGWIELTEEPRSSFGALASLVKR